VIKDVNELIEALILIRAVHGDDFPVIMSIGNKGHQVRLGINYPNLVEPKAENIPQFNDLNKSCLVLYGS